MANETLEFALLAWREDGSWNASRLPDDAAQDIGIALDALRVQQVDGGAIAMLAIDDSFFIVIRQVGEDMKMMMSDALAALEYEIAAEVLELLDIDSPEEDDADEPAGDLNLLSDLGLDAMDLQMICDDSEKYPDEQLESIARQIGAKMQMVLSDVMTALDYEIAAEVLELSDIDFPEEDDANEPAGDLNIFADLGLDVMELQMICDDDEMYPDEQLEVISRRIGFGDEFVELVEKL